MTLKEDLKDLVEIIKKETGKTQQDIALEMGYKKNYISEMLSPKGEVTEKFLTSIKLRFSDVLNRKEKRDVDNKSGLSLSTYSPPAISEYLAAYIGQIEARRNDLERFYLDAQSDKRELYKLLNDFRLSLDTNLTVIQKSLSDNREFLLAIGRVVRANDAEIMDGLDSLEGKPVGTHRKRAGKVEQSLLKSGKQEGRHAGAGKQG